MPSLLIQTPFDGPWLKLDDPVSTLVAVRPGDVVGVLDAADEAAAKGAYVAGFVAYEAAAAFGLATRPPQPGDLPLAWFGVFPADRVQRLDGPTRGTPPAAAAWTPSLDRDQYLAAIERIRAHIGDGDTYQLNFTFRLRAPFDGDAAALFAALTDAQGGRWSAFVDLGDRVICSASPELFFLRDGDRLECRPMKGTRPRGPSADADDAVAGVLRNSAKDRSENVMIVDLVRNDLGRVAQVGSVEVASLFDVERYPAQWQMTSTVTATASNPALSDLFRALFPSGSVTGAPKARSMEIIRALERDPRGVYTGAVGLLAPGGRAHFNVAIRTVVVDRTRRQAEFGVGSGIVWESSGPGEFAECALKADILSRRMPPFELLETLRWDPDRGYTLLARHIDRVRRSAAYFDFTFREHRFRNALQRASAAHTGPARIRLFVDRQGDVRSEAEPLEPVTAPRRVALAAGPVSSGDVFLYHKTTRRAVYDAARAARPDVDGVILWNEHGEITEATDANVVAELDGRRRTPPVACGLLPGTMRAELLGSGEIVESRLTKADLRRATRLFLINSVRGWIDARLVD
ncbi:MAG: aminodeoxychorismate synthase component I [Acidimicrobiia bacterium]|nr:aminodeoxychorismate synthase component I [Acidimicrobiia bacterium]